MLVSRSIQQEYGIRVSVKTGVPLKEGLTNESCVFLPSCKEPLVSANNKLLKSNFIF